MKITFLRRNTSQAIKGIALMLMFVHHFFTFPDWYVDGITYPALRSFAAVMREPTKICVSVFAFLTGYFYFHGREKTFKYSLRKITDLLCAYWMVGIPMFIFAAATGCVNLSLGNLVQEMLLLKRPLMVFCWYVGFYCSVMLLFPLLNRISTAGPVWDFALLVVGTSLVCLLLYAIVPLSFFRQMMYTGARWMPCALCGYVFAKHRLFDAWFNRFVLRLPRKGLRIAVWLIIVCIAAAGRLLCREVYFLNRSIAGLQLTLGLNMDVFYAPLFIYGLAGLISLLKEKGLVLRLLNALGAMSMLMWFVHCIFFNACDEITQPLLYLPGNPLLVLCWGLGLCYLAARLIDPLLKRLLRIKNRLLFGAGK